MRATREALGNTLIELVENGMDVIAVDADLSRPTTTAELGNRWPERLINVGIAEQDMIGVASGLSLTGSTVFTGSFAMFGIGRCYEQIRNTICDSGLNVKLCPTHAGVAVGEDGATHQMLEDIGMMRMLPNMRVLVPADYNSACAAVRLAASVDGPVYVRLGRYPTEDIYEESFEGKLPGATVLRWGNDITLCACGIEVQAALKAADMLSENGISAEVIDIFSVQPLDDSVVCSSASKTGHVVTCEDHMVAGGMGSAVSELLAREHPTPMQFVGMSSFGTSAPADELFRHFGLDSVGIAKAARELLGV